MTPHPEFGDAYELLALSGEAADGPGRQIAQHLAEGCGECQRQMARARATVAALGLLAAPVAPPARIEAELRRRLAVARSPVPAAVSAPLAPGQILAAPSAPRRPPRAWGRPFGFALAAAILLAILSGWLGQQLTVAHRQGEKQEALLSAAVATGQRQTAQAAQFRAALAILTAPGTRTIAARFGTAPPVAHAFINPQRGVVLIGRRLPLLPSARTYEMWLLPAKGAPRPAGLFRPSPGGNALRAYAGDLAGIAGIAVSVEPARGSSAPTGPIVLAVKFSK